MDINKGILCNVYIVLVGPKVYLLKYMGVSDDLDY